MRLLYKRCTALCWVESFNEKIFVMKGMLKILLMMVVGISAVACVTVGAATQTAYEDDVYGVVSSRDVQRVAQERHISEEVQYEEDSYESLVSSGYDDSFERRLRGVQSANYKTASSYYNAINSDAVWYAKIYDPAFYNVVFSGNSVWIEPRYVTAMFGNWGASVVLGATWGNPYWNHWSSCGWNWSFSWGWNYPWSYSYYWSAPRYHYWNHHAYGHNLYWHYHYGYHPRYHYGHGYHNYRPNHRPNRNYAPVYYGGNRRSALGNSIVSQGNNRIPGRYVPSRGSSSVRVVDNDRPIEINPPSYSSSQLLERRRKNENTRGVTSQSQNDRSNYTKAINRAANQIVNSSTGNNSSSSGSSRNSSGGGVNRGRR